ELLRRLLGQGEPVEPDDLFPGELVGIATTHAGRGGTCLRSTQVTEFWRVMVRQNSGDTSFPPMCNEPVPCHVLFRRDDSRVGSNRIARAFTVGRVMMDDKARSLAGAAEFSGDMAPQNSDGAPGRVGESLPEIPIIRKITALRSRPILHDQ